MTHLVGVVIGGIKTVSWSVVSKKRKACNAVKEQRCGGDQREPEIRERREVMYRSEECGQGLDTMRGLSNVSEHSHSQKARLDGLQGKRGSRDLEAQKSR